MTEELTTIDMREIQIVVIRENTLNQLTTYNYPLMTKIDEKHSRCLRIFEKFYSAQESNPWPLGKRGDFFVSEVREVRLKLVKLIGLHVCNDNLDSRETRLHSVHLL